MIDDYSLCRSCLELFLPANCMRRCRYCFEEHSGYCIVKQEGIFEARAFVFESQGPIVSLVHRIKTKRSLYLLRSLAAYLYWQWYMLKWPDVDLIVAAPGRENVALAKAFATFLKIPFIDLNFPRSWFYFKKKKVEQKWLVIQMKGNQNKKLVPKLKGTQGTKIWVLSLCQ